MYWYWNPFTKGLDVPTCLSIAHDSFGRLGLNVWLAPTNYVTVGAAKDGSVVVHVTCVPQSNGSSWIAVTAFSDNNNLAQTTHNNVASAIQNTDVM
jgi:hypothetical protein